MSNSMNAVMLSLRPQWCELIANGKKTIEVRKTRPKLPTPLKVYIYETQAKTDTPWIDEEGHCVFKGRGQVIGEFVCDRIYQYSTTNIEGQDISSEEMQKLSCLTERELYRYEHSAEAKENCTYLLGLYGWHISSLLIYNKPRELSVFGLKRPPQSWCYVEKGAANEIR